MRLGTFFDIEVRVNIFFFVALGVALITGYLETLAMIFVVILLHEAGHCIAARALGVKVERMDILPFGCAAKMQSALAYSPLSEAAIALCGPAVNAALALVAVFLQHYVEIGVDLSWFVQVNLLIGGFNLLPALPLDGGRAVRAFLSHRLGVTRGAKIAVYLTRSIALGCLGLGVYELIQGIFLPNPFFIAGLLGVYSFRTEKAAAYLPVKSMSDNAARLYRKGYLPVRHVAVDGSMTLGELAGRMLPGRYTLVTVVDAGGGLLSEGELVSALIKFGPHARIKRVIAAKAAGGIQ
ncbi:MAG: site-2 protease family protein [Christensenellales bacterium]|jgi:stage IV sporulation protein FB